MSLAHFRVAVCLAAVAVLAAGCGDDSGAAHDAAHTTSSAPNSARTDFDDDDVAFLTMMYPHHDQAVQMARLAPGRAADPRVLDLAARIEAAQAPEMARISALLRDFGKPAPSADAGHAGHEMPGMMSQDRMTALRDTSGAAFDRLWLQLMIEHHLGAITMAETELAGGTNADTLALARAVLDAQRGEVDIMRTALG